MGAELNIRDKQAILEKACRLLNIEGNPFSAEIDGDRLIVSWRWQDAVQLGVKSVSKVVSEFRYVVVLNDNGTFYGYDTDSRTVMGAHAGGAYAQTGSFIGHEIRIRKEISLELGDDGLKVGVYHFSTKLVHDTVKKVFRENLGLKYHEPAVTWVMAEGALKLSFLFIGILFSIIGILGTLLFLGMGIWQGSCITGVFVLLGIWAALTGIGVWKVPVFSVKAGLIFTFGTIIIGWVLAFAIAFGILYKI